MEDGPSMYSFILIFFLIFFNGFFVAAEFAVVKVRPTRIEQLLKEKNKRAKYVKKVLEELDGHLAAAQLGITITSLGIGAVAEPSIAKLIEILFGKLSIDISAGLIHTISVIIGFSLATYFHITIGEQVPKILAIEKAEKISLLTCMPLHYIYNVLALPIKIINSSTNAMLRLFGIKETNLHEVHSAEEIKMILSASPDLGPDEQKMLNKIFDFQDRFVREIMVHRKDMEVIYPTDSLEENLEVIKNSKHSRFPVCREDRDDIIGYVSIKDVYKEDDICFDKLIREIPKIYETTSIKKALKMMQKEHHQIAIVIDEYGGVSGLVTVEDILEEIVGEIQDEFDDEMEPFSRTTHSIIVDASVIIDEVVEELGIHLEEIDGIDTIGGYVLATIELPPKVGQTVIIDHYEVKIIDADEHRINVLEFKKLEQEVVEE